MRGPRRKITYLSPEAREKISRANADRWQDPEYRAVHLARLKAERKKSGNFGGRKRGSKQTPETKEKIRRSMIKLWQDPDFRARHLPHLLEIQSSGGRACWADRPRVRPAKGTPERRQYDKVAEILGPDVARSLQW